MNRTNNRKAAIIWPRMGPYHIARLRAATTALNDAGIDLTGVEIAQTDATYQWDVIKDRNGTICTTLFPSATFETLPASTIWRSLNSWLSANKPDYVAICGWSSADALCALGWCKRNGARAIVMSESKEDDRPRHFLTEIVKSALVRRFSAAVVGGRPHREYIIKLGIPAAKVFDGYDVVDNPYFLNNSRQARTNAPHIRAKLELPERYILSVSRFIDQKNLTRLIDAYRIYTTAMSQTKPIPLVICGGGALDASLKQAARGLEHIVWPGFRQIDELPAIYGLADAFIIPSTIEPWGLVVNEAMACGLPIMSSNTVGARYDLVHKDRNGLLFDPIDTDDIANCMRKFTELDTAAKERMCLESLSIISEWTPQRFAQSMVCAINAADD